MSDLITKRDDPRIAELLAWSGPWPIDLTVAEVARSLDAALAQVEELRKALSDEWPDLDGPEIDLTPEQSAEMTAEYDEWLKARMSKDDKIAQIESELAAAKAEIKRLRGDIAKDDK